MADNIQVTEGSGKTVATDDIGGVLHQRVKLSIGADGAATDLSPGQKTKANSLPVALASDDVLLALLGPINEGTPASEAASAGLNGRLKRIAQILLSSLAPALAVKTFAGDDVWDSGLEAQTVFGYRTLSYSGSLAGGTLQVFTQVTGGEKVAVPDTKLTSLLVDGNGEMVRQFIFSASGRVFVHLTGSSGGTPKVTVQ